MTFRIADPDRLYDVPVTVEVPTDAAAPEAVTFTARFKLLPAAEINAAIDGAMDGRDGAMSDLDFIGLVLHGWDGVEDGDGKALAFDENSLAQLAEIGYWKRAVINGYLQWAAGLPAKNSGRQPADGSAGLGPLRAKLPRTLLH